VDDELGNQLVATMLYLDSENHKDMQLYINCSGGEVMGLLSFCLIMLVSICAHSVRVPIGSCHCSAS
jgi:ATP-dependent protease ClpP protease subunit